jgi:mannose-1-phosphate guanylyltransferase
MAGGSGERFWPLSRKDHPKQLLKLGSPDASLLEEAVSRLEPIIPRQHIYVQTMPHLVHAIRKAGLPIPPENVLAEPCKRNTAGCLIYAAAHLHTRYGDEAAMAVVTADHVIGDPELFRKTVVAALEAAERDTVLVTMGVRPDRPATGYGYIHAPGDGNTAVVRVEGFKEKPDLGIAEQYVADGHYYWNSGMFFWRIASFVGELTQAQPRMAEVYHELCTALEDHDPPRAEEVFGKLENISIDYALMEKARNVAMIRAEFPWDDVGTWSALERTRKTDENGNIAQGNTVVIDSRDCIVYNSDGGEERTVAVVGAEGLVVVVTPDAILVVPKERTEDVKKAVQELERRGAPQL